MATFLTPSLVVKAQTVDTPATTAQVDEVKSTLIALLTQLIAELQAQINTLIAQQASTTQAVAQLTPAKSTQTTFGSVNETVVPQSSISILPITCSEGNDSFVVSVDRVGGQSWKLKYDSFREVTNPTNAYRPFYAVSSPRQDKELTIDRGNSVSIVNIPATYHLTASLLDSNGKVIAQNESTQTNSCEAWGDLLTK